MQSLRTKTKELEVLHKELHSEYLSSKVEFSDDENSMTTSSGRNCGAMLHVMNAFNKNGQKFETSYVLDTYLAAASKNLEYCEKKEYLQAFAKILERINLKISEMNKILKENSL